MRRFAPRESSPYLSSGHKERLVGHGHDRYHRNRAARDRRVLCLRRVRRDARVPDASYFIDRAIAAIAAKKPSTIETMQTMWLLCAAALVLVGGVMLVLLLDGAPWVFLASAFGQAIYLFFVAPRYFDVEDPPDARGRQQSTNAFVVYCAATAFVLWAASPAGWPCAGHMVAAACGRGGGHRGTYRVRDLDARAANGIDETADARSDRRRALRRPIVASITIETSEDHGRIRAGPLWALDEGLYGDFPPEDLTFRRTHARPERMGGRLPSALNRDDPASSLWTEEQSSAHEAAARPLAVRLARERPDLTVYVLDGTTGVVEVHAE